MCGNDAFHERETEPVAVHLAIDRVGAAVERVEDMGQLGRGNARAVIADGDPHFRPSSIARMLGADADPAIASTVFDRVGNQVLHRRSKCGGIAQDLRKIRGDLAMDLHVRGLKQWMRAVDGAFDDLEGGSATRVA